MHTQNNDRAMTNLVGHDERSMWDDKLPGLWNSSRAPHFGMFTRKHDLLLYSSKNERHVFYTFRENVINQRLQVSFCCFGVTYLHGGSENS